MTRDLGTSPRRGQHGQDWRQTWHRCAEDALLTATTISPTGDSEAHPFETMVYLYLEGNASRTTATQTEGDRVKERV